MPKPMTSDQQTSVPLKSEPSTSVSLICYVLRYVLKCYDITDIILSLTSEFGPTDDTNVQLTPEPLTRSHANTAAARSCPNTLTGHRPLGSNTRSLRGVKYTYPLQLLPRLAAMLCGHARAESLSDMWGIPGQIDQRMTPIYFQKI